MAKVIEHVLPSARFFSRFILNNRWPSIDRITAIRAPILFISGGQDQLIPPSHMQELKARALSSSFVEWKLVERGDHNSTWERAGDQYPLWIKSFIEKALIS
jgi:pimeloyl-ACP methyl ester carboxylesterase